MSNNGDDRERRITPHQLDAQSVIINDNDPTQDDMMVRIVSGKKKVFDMRKPTTRRNPSGEK